jgi:hypothetical protein
LPSLVSILTDAGRPETNEEMIMSPSDSVAAVFEHQADSERAVADLWDAGFARDQVDMVSRSQGQTEGTPNFTAQKDAADAALVGAEVGAATGALAGAATMLLVPGLGTVIGGGLLAGILGGAALGAAGGAFLGPFTSVMGEEDAHRLAAEVEEGRIVVLVRAYDRADEARAILQRHGGRSEGMRDEG